MRFSAVPPTLLFLGLSTVLVAHPIPDIPVRGYFDTSGNGTIKVEVDPRCFEADPEVETYLLKIQMEKLMSPAECDSLKVKAKAFVERGVEFFFEPQGAFKPEFRWEFTTLGGGPLVNIDDPVMVTGTWSTKLAEGTEGYSIRASDPRNLSVVFENTLRGKPVERIAVLFPGEKSFVLKMDGSNTTAASAPPELTEKSDLPPLTVAPSWLGGMSWLRAVAFLGAVVLALWLGLGRLRRA